MITIGLAPGKNGFYDPHTNINLIGSSNKKTFNISDRKEDAGRYLNIYRDCIIKEPKLIVYEGNFPQSVIDLYKEKTSENKKIKDAKISEEKIVKIEVAEEKTNEEIIEIAEKVLEEHEDVFEALAEEEKKEARPYNKKYKKHK
jgi:hypothetical protein